MKSESPAAPIATIDAWLVRVPLLEQWAASAEFGGHAVGNGTRLILCVRDADGCEGWGEGATSLDPAAIEASLAHLKRQSLDSLRLPLLDLWSTPNYFQQPLPPSPYAPNIACMPHRVRHPLQCPVEMALLDLIARRARLPLHMLFGGKWRDSVNVDYWMGRTTPEHAKRCVQRALQLGFSGIKLKTALEDPNVERLEAIREAGGESFHVTVDPNGRFHRLDDALPTILAMDAVGNMQVLEDPFPRFYMQEFAALRPRIKARLVLHVESPESLDSVLHARCAGGLNIDSHTQGLLAWRMQAAAAATANLPVWHGSGLDLGIATAAQLHLAAATPNCQLAGDQSGPWLRESSLINESFAVAGGHITVPTGPGTGVSIDPNALERYTTQRLSIT